MHIFTHVSDETEIYRFDDADYRVEQVKGAWYVHRSYIYPDPDALYFSWRWNYKHI